MLKQHFNAIREYAEKMTSGKTVSEKTAAEKRNVESAVNESSVNNPPASFEQQLRNGLHTPVSQLLKNNAGWCYRNVPVVLYGQEQQAKRIHFSSQCGELNATNSQQQWLWAKSSEGNNLTENQGAHSQNEWCSQCLLAAGFPPNHDFNFIDFVKQNSHHYFHQKSITLWSPGKPIAPLKFVHSERDTAHEEHKENEHEYENENEHENYQCQHCTWQLPEDSPYFISNQRFPTLADDGQHYCLLCIQAHTQQVMAIPEALRWQALQQRYQYFNGICENWSHLRLHIDVSWHPLINTLQQKGIEMPRPYHALYQGQRFITLAPLVWKDKKRAVVMNKENLEGIEEDWNIISYGELLNSLG